MVPGRSTVSTAVVVLILLWKQVLGSPSAYYLLYPPGVQQRLRIQCQLRACPNYG